MPAMTGHTQGEHMAVNSDLARLYGSDNDSVHIGPTSATFPTTLDADPAGFEEIGWLDSDTGITETLLGSITEIRGHQGNGVVRTRVENPGTQFQFVALETKELTNGLRYDVKSSTTEAGVRREVRGSGQKAKRRKIIIDLFDQISTDDDEIKMRAMATVEIVPNGDRVYVNSEIAGYPMLATVIGDIEVLETDVENA
jgi:hypothetical protein